MAGTSDIWGGSGFRKMGRKFLQRKQLLLWSGFTGTAFYISTRHVAFVKKNPILQRWLSGPGWKPGSGKGNDSQGQWGGALGEISYNRWYLAKSEAISCCWDAAVAQGFALTVIKPSSFCLVSPSSLWDLNDVTMVVVVAQHIIELSIFMLQSQHVVQANQKSEHCNLALI